MDPYKHVFVNGATLFELMPSGGNWTFSVLHSSTGTGGQVGRFRNLVMDLAGNLDGTYPYGSVFELSPNGSAGWTYTDLHDFTAQADGAFPQCNLIFDASGNLYGTAQEERISRWRCCV